MSKDLRVFLDDLQERLPYDFVRIERTVAPHQFEVTALLDGAPRPFGLDGLGRAAERLLDRPASRRLAERFLRAVEQFQVDLDRGALDHARIVLRIYVQINLA